MGNQIESKLLQGKVAVVTGTSRGIGAEIAVSLASAGADVIGNHVDPRKESKQDDTAARVLGYGVYFKSVLADISEESGRKSLVSAATEDPNRRFDQRNVDFLILNAAGGLERDKPEDWAEKINIESQRGLIIDFLSHLNPGGKIIFMTSLWAHHYGDVKQLPAYGPVASTKHEFEQELRSRIPALGEKRIGVGIVVGHVVRGTAAHLIFSRMAKEELARLEQMSEGGHFPDASDMGNAVKDMLVSGFESGHTRYVGGTYAERIERLNRPFIRDELRLKLPMYSNEKMLVDTFKLENTGAGLGTYTVRPYDTDGHFTGPFDDIQLWRGVDQLESLAQTLGLTILDTEGDTGALGVFRGVRGRVRFMGMIFPGNTAELRTLIKRRTSEGVIGDGEIKIGEKVLMQAEGIDIGIIPNASMARKIIELQRAQRKV